MTDLRTAAQQALEALHVVLKDDYRLPYEKIVAATDALNVALAEPTPFEDVVTHGSAWSKDGKRIDPMSVYAEPVQEPFCYVYEYDSPYGLHREFYPREYNGMKPSRTVPLYTAPPPRKPLTDEKVCDLWSWSMTTEAERTATTQQHAFARAIERAHGIGGQDEP